MTDKSAGGANDGAVADPAASRPGGPLPGDGESIVVPPAILKQQAGWGQAEARRAGSGAAKDEEPQVFASNVRKKDLSEAGYDENPASVGRLGVILGTVLAVLLVGSGVTLYLANRPDGDKPPAAADAAPSAAPTPTQDPVPPITAEAKVLPTVAGEFGQKATITLPTEAADGGFVVKTLVEGTGPKVDKGNWVTVDFTSKNWTTGKDMASSFDNNKPQLFQAGGGKLIPALDDAVTGHTAGSRLVVIAPPAAAFGAQGNAQMGVGAKDNLVFVIDIKQATAPDATVSGDVAAPAEGMPKVTDNGKKPATITPVPGVAAPTELKTSVLIQGKGRKIESGEKVVVQYTGALYADGKQFDSSLERGQAFSFVTGGGGVIEGWDKAVTGQAIGSRIEVVIPSALGYGEKGSGDKIPANATLVFVIDILDAGVGAAD